MADRPGIPVVVLASGGRAVTQVAAIGLGQTMTPTTTKPGQAITLVASGGIPAVLVNEDGTQYVP